MNEPRVIQLLNLRIDSANKNFSNPMIYRVYSAQGICPAICTMGGGSHEPKIIEIMEPQILGYTRDEKGHVTDRHEIEVANTIHTSTGSGGNTGQYVLYPDKEYTQDELRGMIISGKARVRKLTARECFRLQGVDDNDIDKIYATGLSNNQMIALAGNSITVDVMYHILRKLYIDTNDENQQRSLFE